MLEEMSHAAKNRTSLSVANSTLYKDSLNAHKLVLAINLL